MVYKTTRTSSAFSSTCVEACISGVTIDPISLLSLKPHKCQILHDFKHFSKRLYENNSLQGPTLSREPLFLPSASQETRSLLWYFKFRNKQLHLNYHFLSPRADHCNHTSSNFRPSKRNVYVRHNFIHHIQNHFFRAPRLCTVLIPQTSFVIRSAPVPHRTSSGLLGLRLGSKSIDAMGHVRNCK